MRNLVWCLIGLAFFSGGCLKENDHCSPNGSVAPAAEVQALKNYLDSNAIPAIKHSSGLYYVIVSDGTGTTPNVCSSIKVNFIGKLTNGTKFEGDNNILVTLKFLLPAWQIGLPLIKPGGRILLYVPPSLGYGGEGKTVNSNVVVPPNSILIYDISLILVE